MATISPHPGRPVARRDALVLLLAGLGLSGCQSININATHSAQVRVIVATPDAPAQDFYENNSGLAYNLGFGTVTSYMPLPSGAYMLSSARANTTQTLVSAKATLGSTKQYTVIVGNIAANLQETLLQDQSQPAPAGEVSLRFVQQATHTGPMDVYLIPSGGKLAATTPVATNLDFGNNSGYINVPAGTYAIAVLPAGTTPVPTTVTLHTSTQVSYTSGSARTIVFIDQPVATAPGVQAVVADDYDP